MKKIIIYTFFVIFIVLGGFVVSQNQQISIRIHWQWIIIWTPNNLDLWTITSWSIVEVSFWDHFWIEDLRWSNTGHYTTMQCDGLYGEWAAAWVVITGVQLSWANVERLLWLENDTLIYSNLVSWTDITSPQLYLYRNNNISNGWVWNKYWNKPSIRITVPDDVPVGTYKGKITYTLYDYWIDF